MDLSDALILLLNVSLFLIPVQRVVNQVAALHLLSMARSLVSPDAVSELIEITEATGDWLAVIDLSKYRNRQS